MNTIKRDGSERYYAGIGSRSTPIEIQTVMKNIATILERKGYILRSGGALGADKAFQSGVINPNNCDIFLASDTLSQQAIDSVHKYHPMPKALSSYAFKLMARNYYQIKGKTEDSIPSYCVICWTPDGCTSHQERTIKTGGTGQAISIASESGITVYNLANPETLSKFKNWISKNTQ